jgi:hypothetical protein
MVNKGQFDGIPVMLAGHWHFKRIDLLALVIIKWPGNDITNILTVDLAEQDI